MNTQELRMPLRDAPAEGDVRTLELAGRPIGLYRVNGALHALANRCPHRGAPICAGMIATPIHSDGARIVAGAPHSAVRCPWHKWEFDIATGRCLVDKRLRIRRYAVRIDGDELVVNLRHPD
jgi:nitrite reductase (NADH) small subunit